MIKIIKTKKLNSTTSVTGTLVQASDGQWYSVTMLQPPRNPWFLRATKSSSTGRPSPDEIFMKKCKGKPEIQEAVDMLVGVLNGEEPIRDRMAF
jgi:hypothetical protein